MHLATLSTWRGYPLWKCKLCGSTFTQRERMERHLTGGGTGHNIKIDFAIPDVADEFPAPSPEDAPPSETKPTKASKPDKED